MQHKKDVPLLVGIAIPIFMIIFVAASIYLPDIFNKPQQDFLYTGSRAQLPGPEYQIKDTRLSINCNSFSDEHYASLGTQPPTCTAEDAGKLYIHSVAENSSREIPYDEAQALVLNVNEKSKDGYTVVTGGSDDLFSLFFRLNVGGFGERYLKKGNISKKLEIINSSDRSSYGFRFLGWIEG